MNDKTKSIAIICATAVVITGIVCLSVSSTKRKAISEIAQTQPTATVNVSVGTSANGTEEGEGKDQHENETSLPVSTSTTTVAATPIPVTTPAQVLPAVCEHEYAEVKSGPDCLHGEYYTYTCNKCGFTLKSDEIGEPLGHNLRKVEVIAPTATEKGYDLYICIRCGEEFKKNEKAALGKIVRYNDVYDSVTAYANLLGLIIDSSKTVNNSDWSTPPKQLSVDTVNKNGGVPYMASFIRNMLCEFYNSELAWYNTELTGKTVNYAIQTDKDNKIYTIYILK